MSSVRTGQDETILLSVFFIWHVIRDRGYVIITQHASRLILLLDLYRITHHIARRAHNGQTLARVAAIQSD